MSKIAIIDLGSNTIVLNVFDTDQNLIYHESLPAHLIQYVNKEKVMCLKGIKIAQESIHHYAQYLRVNDINNVYILITEPARIKNQSALLIALKKFNYTIYPLSGEQEAYYDSLAIAQEYPYEKEWFAFDIGGGSTELIHYNNGKKELYSLPLGCVRLANEKHTLKELREILQKITDQHQNLLFKQGLVVGIGGTIKAIWQILYPNSEKKILKKEIIEELYQKIATKDLDTLTKLQTNVPISRQRLIYPGLMMIIAIIQHFNIQEVNISQQGVRKGFLIYLLAHKITNQSIKKPNE